eukprot:gene9981-3149_t
MHKLTIRIHSLRSLRPPEAERLRRASGRGDLKLLEWLVPHQLGGSDMAEEAAVRKRRNAAG